MNDPVLLFFVALAAFLSYRLFSVLGTRGGHEPSEEERMQSPLSGMDPSANDAPNQEEEPLRPNAPVPAWAEPIVEYYPGFDPKSFEAGAKSAYEMIVQSFARGDLSKIRDYVDGPVFAAFEAGVQQRSENGQTMDVTFVGIDRSDVHDARRVGDQLEVMIDYRSDQIRVTRDKDGNIVDGDPNRIDLVRDRWTFSRPIGSTDPNWILTATGGVDN